MEFLLCVKGSLSGTRIPLDADCIRFGRDPRCTVALDDDGVSRVHAEINRSEHGLILNDLNSTNGTFLNSTAVKEAMLQPGDRLRIGNTTLVYNIRSTSTMSHKLKITDDDMAMSSSGKIEDIAKRSSSLDIPETENPLLILQDITTRMAGMMDVDALLNIVTEELLRYCSADRCAILLLNDEGNLSTRVIHTLAGKNNSAQEAISISRQVAHKAIQEGESLLCANPSLDARFEDSVAFNAKGVNSLVCVPLKVRDKTLGLIYLDTLGFAKELNESALHIVSVCAMHIAIRLDNAQLYNELLEANEYSSNIMKNLAEGLCVFDKSGVITRINPSACQILNIQYADAIGSALQQHPQLQELHKLIEATQVQGIPANQTPIQIEANNSTKHLTVSTSILENYKGLPDGVISAIRDTTQIRKIEEQLKRHEHLASLGEMAAGVAHEIRNPLNGIRGFTQLLQEEFADGTAAEYLQIVVDEVDRMNNIVSELLEFARQKEIITKPTDIGEIAASVINELESTATQSSIEIDWIPPKTPIIATANKDKLKQVVLNVAQNAIQAMESSMSDRKLSIWVINTENAEKTQCVELGITDTGEGIAPEQLQKIFDPFFTTKDSGTGLGLSICQKIITGIGGTIDVSSTVGKGTTFLIHLQLVRTV